MPSARNHTPEGIALSVQTLAGLEPFARKLLYTRRLHTASTQGGHDSRLRGRGLEFREVREYQAGDDIRHIDWRVTARTTQAHTKVFQEERERPAILCVDLSRSMYFGSRTCFKHVCAGHAASLLAWSALQRGDRVGGLVFNDQGHRELRPRRSSKAVLHFIATTCEFADALPGAAGEHDINASLEELRRITRPGSSVFIVSDFADAGEQAERHLRWLGQHNDVIAISINDPLERVFPVGGRVRLSDGEQRLSLQADGRFQERFAQQRREFEQWRNDWFRRCRVRHIELVCGEPIFEPLREGLRR